MTKLAYVFPGQGSQEVTMLREIASEVLDLFAEASAILGYDLWKLVQKGPPEQLNQTEFTQPALLTASLALYRLAQARGDRAPDLVAGHSLGEYSALVVAGVLSFPDAVALVQQRGQFMQSAVPLGEGGMAAVLGLTDAQIQEACAQAAQGEVLQIANYNSPGQAVIAGQQAALARAVSSCQAAGARRVLMLPVSAPFHTALMRPAADRMSVALDRVQFKAPNIPVVQNVNAQLETDPAQIKDNLVTQIYGAVRWTDTIQKMRAEGVDTFIESGPGKVLSGLIRRIDKTLTMDTIKLLPANTLTSTLTSAGTLAK